MAGKFELKKSNDGQFYFHLKAANGEIILVSERYKVKASAEHGIQSVKKNAVDDKHYERKQTQKGQPMFNLRAVNHEVIGTSESYSSAEARDAGIEAVKRDAPEAPVEDLSA
jgi:uncharacterized protein